MTQVLNPEQLLRALHDNLAKLAELLTGLDARHVGLGDVRFDEFPVDPTRVDDLRQAANFRLEPRLGDLDIMQWVAGIETHPPGEQLAAGANAGEVDGIPLRVCGLDDLIAMKRAAGRPRDLDDLQRLGAAPEA